MRNAFVIVIYLTKFGLFPLSQQQSPLRLGHYDEIIRGIRGYQAAEKPICATVVRAGIGMICHLDTNL